MRMTRRSPLLLIVVLTACGGGSAGSVNGTARLADTLAMLTAANEQPVPLDRPAVPFPKETGSAANTAAHNTAAHNTAAHKKP